MKNKVYPDFDSAVADMKDGMTFMSPGFGNVGLARNLLAAVHRLGVKELTGISNNAGTLDDRVDVGTLIEARQVKKMICAFTAPTHPSQITPFVQMYNDDELDAELVPQGTLAERMRACRRRYRRFLHSGQRRHGAGRGQGAPGDQRTHLRFGIPAARRFRAHTRIPRRHLRQPAVPADPAQLQPDHGDGRRHHGG